MLFFIYIKRQGKATDSQPKAGAGATKLKLLIILAANFLYNSIR